jgi:hypothetical protein
VGPVPGESVILVVPVGRLLLPVLAVPLTLMGLLQVAAAVAVQKHSMGVMVDRGKILFQRILSV